MVLVDHIGSGFYIIFKSLSNKDKERVSNEKYGDKHLVDKLMKRMFWQGQSEGQLIDSLGKPIDIDQKVLKTKVKEVWKYNKTGKGRYALRVTLENGKVIGWDQK
ncbi:hypothetical protein ACSZMZ_01735 [Aeromonas veronii]